MKYRSRARVLKAAAKLPQDQYLIPGLQLSPVEAVIAMLLFGADWQHVEVLLNPTHALKEYRAQRRKRNREALVEKQRLQYEELARAKHRGVK